MPVDEQIRPHTRVHSLVLRAMAASAAAPSAAAAFLLSHAGEFAGGSDEQTMLLIRATQEIAYRVAAYESAALLLGVLIGLGPDNQDFEVGLPVFESSHIQAPPAAVSAGDTDRRRIQSEPGAAFDLAVTALTDLAADRRYAAVSTVDSGHLGYIRDSAHADRATFSFATMKAGTFAPRRRLAGSSRRA